MPARQPSLPPRTEPPTEDLARLVLSMSPGQLAHYAAGLDEDGQQLLEQVVAEHAAQGWRATPDSMAAHLTGGRFRRWAYVRLLGTKFREAVEGTSTRQIWLLPARYGKSTIGSQWGPTWALDLHPGAELILTSYGDELAGRNAAAVRDLLLEHQGDLRVQLRRDRRRADRMVTDQGGSLMAAGVGSAMTGFGAGGGGGVVIDDPFKNWQEAHSPARRELVANWYRSVVRLRLNDDKAFVLVVMTRWHEDDLAGQLLAADLAGDGEGWDVVRLPALAEAPSENPTDPPWLRQNDPLERSPGEPLEPERFDLAAVLSRHRAIGSYLVAGMEQQRPAPEEGGELKRAWWRWGALPPAFDDTLSSWDMKLKDNETGDFVVGQVWGRVAGTMWLRHQLRGQWDQATTTNAIALAQVRYPDVMRHVIENTGNGPEVMAALRKPHADYLVTDSMAGTLGMTAPERDAVQALRRRGMSGLVPHTPKGSKTVRARAHSGLLEAGDVWLPEGEMFAHQLVDEAASFPAGAHDDQVDAWSQAMTLLAVGEARLSTGRGGPLPATGAPVAARGAIIPRARISASNGRAARPSRRGA